MQSTLPKIYSSCFAYSTYMRAWKSVIYFILFIYLIVEKKENFLGKLREGTQLSDKINIARIELERRVYRLEIRITLANIIRYGYRTLISSTISIYCCDITIRREKRWRNVRRSRATLLDKFLSPMRIETVMIREAASVTRNEKTRTRQSRSKELAEQARLHAITSPVGKRSNKQISARYARITIESFMNRT